MSRKIIWSFVALAPIVALVCFEVITLLQGYNGRCGLLDAGWDCSKAEYVFSVVFSPFFLPVLFICGGGWLLLLLLAGFAIRTYRRGQRVAT